MKKFREEYIGAAIQITDSKNKQLIGIQGKVLDETKNTFIIQTKDNEKTILKKDTVFSIDGKTIDGSKILKRPEDRVKLKKK
ncbi:MAG: ribonuclease P protein subunit [archaeon]